MYAQNKYQITQPQINFVFDFDYRDETEVKVYINGIPFTGFEFLGANTLQFEVSPPIGSVVIIRRETPLDSPATDFEAGSTLNPEELDKAIIQLLHVTQEIHDREGITLGLDDKFDAQGKQIKNLAEPVNPTDAATFNTVTGGGIAACQEQAAIATQKAQEASDYADQAANSALQAGTIIDYEGEEEPSVTKALLKWHKPSEKIIYIRNLTNNAWIAFMNSETGQILVKVLNAVSADLAEASDGGFFHFHGEGPFSGVPIERTQSDQDCNFWRTVGPTGSGANIIWTELDSLPEGTKGIRVYITGTVTGNDSTGATARIKIRKNGSSVDPPLITICNADKNQNTYNNSTLEVLIDSSKMFQLYWTKAFTPYYTTDLNFKIYLAGSFK